MTQEDKQLLLKDLYARVPYRPKVKVLHIWNEEKETEEDIVDTVYCVFPEGYINTGRLDSDIPLNDIVLYLRPLSSMTKEEYNSMSWEGCNHVINYSMKHGFQFVEITSFTIEIFDWLNEHYFDYRELIEKSLAIVAPEGMYKTE